MNNKTKKLSSKGWAKKSPKRGRERNKMMRKCGKKCFLGTKTRGDKQHPDFPICAKGTCRINKKGLWAAYIRAKEWGNKRSTYKSSKPSFKRSYYTKISRKAKRMLEKRGARVGH